MRKNELKTLVEVFENQVIIKGLEMGVFERSFDISIRDDKLTRTHFGASMGGSIDTDQILVIDYYGYSKKSTGFIELAKRRKEVDEEVKMLESNVVFFASIKIEHIVKINRADPHLLVLFTKLKDEILVRRGFKRQAKHS